MSAGSFKLALEKLYAFGTTAGRVGHQDFLRAVAPLFRSHATTLHYHDRSHHVVHADDCVGVPAPMIDELLAGIGGHHEWFERTAHRIVAEGFVDADSFTDEPGFESSIFYRGFLRPMDIHRGAAFCLWSGDNGQMAALTVNRDKRRGRFSAHEHEVAHRLLPHLRNIYNLQRRLSWLEAQIASFRAALDRLNFGAILLDRHGRIVFANSEAQRICAQKLGVVQRAGRVYAGWAPDDLPLRRLIDMACAGSVLFAPGNLMLHASDGSAVATATVSPVPAATTIGWTEPNVAMVMFVHPLKPKLADVADALRHAFRLTEAETALACALLGGMTLAQAGEHLGKSVNTLRSQLRVLFVKTGTQRQSGLVRVLGQAAS